MVFFKRPEVFLMLCTGLTGLALLSGCGKGKEQAAVALDEAKLTISAARKAGATLNSSSLREAEGRLRDAEQSFKDRDFKASLAAASDATAAAEKAKQGEVDRRAVGKSQKPPRKRTRAESRKILGG